MKTKQRTWTGVAAFVFLGLLFLSGIPGYMWALHLEKRWYNTKPATRAELEKHLSLYSIRPIPPVESMHGNSHVLIPGERMEQYLLLWSAPLDVVYDPQDNIRAIYTSYE